MSRYDHIIKQFSTVNIRNLTLLSCSFSDNEIGKTLELKSNMFSNLTKNLSLITIFIFCFTYFNYDLPLVKDPPIA